MVLLCLSGLCVYVGWSVSSLVLTNTPSQYGNYSNVPVPGQSGSEALLTSAADGSVVLAASANCTAVLDDAVLLQGARTYTFSVSVTTSAFSAVGQVAPNAVFVPGMVALTAAYTLLADQRGGSASLVSSFGGPYIPPAAPICVPPTASPCPNVGLPTGATPTRRRLLDVLPTNPTTTTATSATAYYTCISPTLPCNHSTLSVSLSVPFTLADQPLVTFQIAVQGLSVTLDSAYTLTSAAFSAQSPPATLPSPASPIDGGGAA